MRTHHVPQSQTLPDTTPRFSKRSTCVKKGVESSKDGAPKRGLPKSSIHRFPTAIFTKKGWFRWFFLIDGSSLNSHGQPVRELEFDGFLDERLAKTMPHSSSFLGREAWYHTSFCTFEMEDLYGFSWSTFLDKRHPRVSSQKFIGFVNCKWFSSIENENGSCGLLFHPWFLWLEDHILSSCLFNRDRQVWWVWSWFFRDEYSLTMECLQYKRMPYQSCTINNSKYLYILHSFTSQNNLKVKPHFVFRCFTQKAQWDFIFAPGTNLLRKFQKFQVPWSPKPRNPSSRHVLGDSTREVLVFRTSSWYPEIEQCLYLTFLVCIEIGAT